MNSLDLQNKGGSASISFVNSEVFYIEAYYAFSNFIEGYTVNKYKEIIGIV